MSRTFAKVLILIEQGAIRISAHGYDELAADSISTRDVLTSINRAVIVEDYPEYGKGPAVLTLQYDSNGLPIHVLWGIPKGKTSPAVLVTAYRPDPQRWSDDFMRRKP